MGAIKPVARITFPYILVNRYGLLPMFDIFVIGRNNERIKTRVLVDSGATDIILPLSIAIDAGFKIPDPLDLPVQYGGSQTRGIRIETYFNIGTRRLHADIIYAERLAFSERPQYPLIEFRW